MQKSILLVIALLALISLGSMAVYFIRKKKNSPKPSEDFEILED